MRIGERLIEGSIEICAEHTGDKLAKGFEGIVRSTGVRFTTFETVIRNQVKVDHSSLTGVMWRKLLGNIGPAIRNSSGVFPEPMKDRLASLFEDFHNLLVFVGRCTRDDAAEVARRANLWVRTYLGMGYHGFRMTPYVHIFVTHLPHSVKLFGAVARLSGELVEKQNDSIKKTHMQKTNHRSPRLTLQTQLRIELQEAETKLEAHLNPVVRKRKQMAQHPWQGEGIKEREKRRRLQEEEERVAATVSQQSPNANLSLKELKDLIYARTGQKTRKQNQQNLIDILTRIDENS